MDPKNFLLVPELLTEQKLDEQQKIIQLSKLKTKLKDCWNFTDDEIKELIKQAEAVQYAIDCVWQTVPHADYNTRLELLAELLPKDLSAPNALTAFQTALALYTNARKKAMETVRHIFPDAAPDECNDILEKFWTDDYPVKKKAQRKFEAELSLYKRERERQIKNAEAIAQSKKATKPPRNRMSQKEAADIWRKTTKTISNWVHGKTAAPAEWPGLNVTAAEMMQRYKEWEKQKRMTQAAREGMRKPVPFDENKHHKNKDTHEEIEEMFSTLS